MTEIDSLTLRARIESAFAERAYPGDEHLALTQPGCCGYEGDEVPEEVKRALRDPTPEARAAERAIVESHARLLEMLTPEETAAVRAVLEYLVPLLRDEHLGDRFNPAAGALESFA